MTNCSLNHVGLHPTLLNSSLSATKQSLKTVYGIVSQSRGIVPAAKEAIPQMKEVVLQAREASLQARAKSLQLCRVVLQGCGKSLQGCRTTLQGCGMTRNIVGTSKFPTNTGWQKTLIAKNRIKFIGEITMARVNNKEVK